MTYFVSIPTTGEVLAELDLTLTGAVWRTAHPDLVPWPLAGLPGKQLWECQLLVLAGRGLMITSE